MLRMLVLAAVFTVAVPLCCSAQDSVGTPAIASDGEPVSPGKETESRSDDRDESATRSDLKLVFVLLMFTNAIICGHWAISTDRNFWGWYLFGLFTGPLAGGSMLHYHALDKSGETKPEPVAGVLGIGIPIAGFVIWSWLLS